MRRALLWALALGLCPSPARAEPRAGVDLEVKRAPARVRIAMRAESEGTSPSPATLRSSAAPAPSLGAVAAARTDAPLADLGRRLVFHAQLGYAVDQGDTPDPTLVDPQNRSSRPYGFGDAVLGTNGMFVPSLSTYFAARFRLEQRGVETSTSVPTIYDALGDRGDLLVRSAYAEITAPGAGVWKPLRVRAGRQFRQGVGLIHFDGIVAAYETSPVDLSLLVGRRVALYAASAGFLAAGGDAELVRGGSLRLRLARLAGVPITLAGDWLNLRDEANLAASVRVDLARDLAVVGAVRLRDGEIARAGATVQASLSSRTVLRVEADERLEGDWAYDMVLTADDASDDPARRFLRVGPPLRRTRTTARAGTVLSENLDVNLFGTGAWERDPERDAPYSPTYLEYGGAIEGRFRGGLAAGVELSTRSYTRGPISIYPDPGGPSPLVDVATWGERAFEGALVELRYSMGPRRLSGEAQIYTRRYEVYTPAEPTGVVEARAGGRFRLEGWVDKRVRLLAEYEVTGALPGVAPELAGLQSLRFLGEASF